MRPPSITARTWFILIAVLILLALCLVATPAPAHASPDVPKPASFEFRIEASRFSEYSLTVQGEPLLENHVYTTQPLYYYGEAEIVLTIMDGDRQKVETFTIYLKPGYHHAFTVTVPRLFPTVALV